MRLADGRGKRKARGGAARPCAFGLGPCGSVTGEAANQTEQAAETTAGQHQCPAGRNAQTTVGYSLVYAHGGFKRQKLCLTQCVCELLLVLGTRT